MIAPKGLEKLDDSDVSWKYCISKSTSSSLVVAPAEKNEFKTTKEGSWKGSSRFG